MELLLNGAGHALAPYEPLKEARAGQTVSPVQAGAGDFTHGIEPAGRRLSPLVYPYATTGIVRSGDHGYEVFGNIHPILQALRVDGRKVLANTVLRDIR